MNDGVRIRLVGPLPAPLARLLRRLERRREEIRRGRGLDREQGARGRDADAHPAIPPVAG